MTQPKTSLQWRAFTSVLIAVTSLALALSGTILFLSPPGRVANWSDWRMLGLTKHDWTGLHVWFSVVFVAGAILHLIFNLRPLLNYFKDRLTRQVTFRREWMLAVGFCALVFTGVRSGVPPFSTFLDFNERVKRSWEDPRQAAPIPHAELLTLAELAVKAEVSLDLALQRLAEKGVRGATSNIVVSSLAAQNDLPALRIYEILRGTQSPGRPAVTGGSGEGTNALRSTEGHRGGEGAGRGTGGGPGGGRGGWGGGGGPGSMTLTEFCESRNIALNEAQARLEARKLKITPGRTLREIATDNGYDRPYEIMEIIEGRSR